MSNAKQQIFSILSRYGFQDAELVKEVSFDGHALLARYKNIMTNEAAKEGCLNEPFFQTVTMKPLNEMLASTSLKSTKEMYKFSNGETMKAIFIENGEGILSFAKFSKAVVDIHDGEESSIIGFDNENGAEDGIAEWFVECETPAALVSAIDYEIEMGF